MRSFSSTTSLKASASSPATPVRLRGRRMEKSPLRKARNAASNSRVSDLGMSPSGPGAREPRPREVCAFGAVETVDDMDFPRKSDVAWRRGCDAQSAPPPVRRTGRTADKFRGEIKNLRENPETARLYRNLRRVAACNRRKLGRRQADVTE